MNLVELPPKEPNEPKRPPLINPHLAEDLEEIATHIKDLGTLLYEIQGRGLDSTWHNAINGATFSLVITRMNS